MSDFNLGTVTAYGYAKDKGYTGTEEEFAELMASYASVAESAAASAESAAASATTATTKAGEASTSASNAATSATTASTAATTATTKAGEASTSASTASTKASEATTAAATATTKAGEASTSATNAAGSATTASTAATTATTKASEAAASATAAAQSAASLVIDDTLTHAGQAADAKQTGDEISSLKEEINSSVDVSSLGWELGTLDTNGTPTSATNRIRSGYVEVTTGTIVTVSGNTNCLSVHKYGKNKEYLGYTTDWSSEFVVPSGTYYIRILIRKNSWNGTIESSEVSAQAQRCAIVLKLTKNGILLAYTNEEIGGAIDKSNRADSLLDGSVYPEVTPVSAIMASALLMNKTTGAISSTGSSYWRVSDSINVVEGESYILNSYMSYDNGVVGFYDTNGDKVSVIPASSGSAIATNMYQFTDYMITVPADAVTMRIGAYINTGYSFTLTKFVKYRIGELKFQGKKWTVFGDSLTAVNSRTNYHYFDYISGKTGISVVNKGVSGSGYRNQAGSNSAFYQVVSAVPTDSDVVTIFGGFNDGLTDLGTASDTGTTTVGGCINTTLDNLYAVMPVVQIGIISPTPWVGANPYNHSEANAYIDLLEEICKKRSIPFLNLYYESNLRPWDSTFRTLAYSKDDGNGVHPDETGHRIIASRIEGFIDSLVLS